MLQHNSLKKKKNLIFGTDLNIIIFEYSWLKMLPKCCFQNVVRQQLCPELISKPWKIILFHINTEENVISTEIKLKIRSLLIELPYLYTCVISAKIFLFLTLSCQWQAKTAGDNDFATLVSCDLWRMSDPSPCGRFGVLPLVNKMLSSSE